MKKVRRIGVIAALITMLSMSVIMQGCKKKYQEIALYKYTENTDGTLTITELTDKGKSEYELSVPAELDGKKVSAIGDSAFKDDVIIKSVDIADGIEYIGSSAFLSCYNLENISIPQTVTDIGSHAFTETAWVEKQFASSSDIIINNILYQAEDDVEDYVVKDGVVTIASGVFYNNTTIKNVTLPSSVKNKLYTLLFSLFLTCSTQPLSRSFFTICEQALLVFPKSSANSVIVIPAFLPMQSIICDST